MKTHLLAILGPQPDRRLADSEDEALKLAAELGVPALVYPLRGWHHCHNCGAELQGALDACRRADCIKADLDDEARWEQ